MTSRENLHQQIKDLLLQNNGDLRISDHPQLVRDARDQHIEEGELSRLISTVYQSINWRVLEHIDQKLLDTVNRNGIINERDANAIINEVKEEMNSDHALSYMVKKLRKIGLEPRDRIPLDWTSFKNPWMTEKAWKALNTTTVNGLNEKASTLEKMGEISYRKIEETKYAIKNTHALPPLVTVLTRDSSKHEEFVHIIQDEPDLEKRYLKILYRLNPGLPFRFNGKEYPDVVTLLNDACSSAENFWALVTTYKNGYVHVWVEESSPTHKNKLTDNKDLNGFLTFLYSVDPNHPFYIQKNKYSTPELLAAEARQTSKDWFNIFTAIDNGNLLVWFTALGKQDWIRQIEEGRTSAKSSGLYNDDECRNAVIQTLINVTDPLAGLPQIGTGTKTISLPQLEAGKPVRQIIQLRLENEGFVKAGIHMQNGNAAITIDKNILLFHSQENVITQEVVVTIDPVLLVKNEQYECTIIIHTLFQQIEIPVLVKAVFPKKAYTNKLVLYALSFAAFFGLVRFVLKNIIPAAVDLRPVDYIPFGFPAALLPFNPLSVVILLAVLITTIYFSIRLIKKLEKI